MEIEFLGRKVDEGLWTNYELGITILLELKLCALASLREKKEEYCFND